MRARKNTPRRCFADGGKVDPEQLMRDMAAKYGGGAATKIAADPPPPPVTEVAMVKPEQPKPGLIGKAMGILGGRKELIDKAAGYANGGVIQSGNSFSQDMSPDNWVQAAPSVTPAATPATTPEPVRDQHGNDMTFTNKMKAQLGEAPAGIAAPPVNLATSAPSQTESAQQAPKSAFSVTPAAPAAAATPLPVSAKNPVPQIAAFDGNPSSGLRSLRGYAHGGKIKGPGTPTSDSIDGVVRETGEPIAVSTNERILSAAQDQAMEGIAQNMGFDSLDAMLEQTTGKPVGPTIKAGKRAAASGGTFADVIREDLDKKTAIPAVSIAQMRDNVAATQARQSAQTEAPSAPVSAAPQAVQPGSPVSAPSEYNPVRTNDPYRMSPMPASGQQGTRVSLPTLPNLSDSDVKGIASYSAPVSQDPHAQAKAVSSPQIAPDPAIGQSVPPINLLSLAKEQSIPPAILALVQNAPGPQSTPSGTVDVGSTAPGGTFKNGGNTYSVSATKQDGITKITAPGKTPTFTNVDAMQAVGQLNSVKPGAPVVTGMDLKGANESMARANAIRQSIIDGDGTGPKVTMIENSGLKESQALMDKWDMERLAKQNPQAAGIMRDVRLGDARVASDAMHDQTTRRGQDLNAATHAAQIAGNPTDNALKQTSIAMNRHALTKAGQQDSMLDNINKETDPTRRRALMDNLLVSQGKNPAEHRYLKVEGGEEIAPDGFTKVKRPSGVYDTVSGKFIPMDGAPQVATKPVNVQAGMPVNAPDGTHTYQGKTITVKNGKVTGVA